MDKEHKMDAPDNDSLKIIEQVADHSELSTIYPHAHNEWEGEDLLSREAREEKREQEQLLINTSIRKWFAVIGLLTLLPFVLGFIVFTFGVIVVQSLENIPDSNRVLIIVPAILAALAWLVVSYKSIKKVYAIFYDHSIKATPFVVMLLALTVFTLPALFLTMDALYTSSIIYNSIISSSLVLAIGIALSGILLLIWTSSKMSGVFKFGAIGIIAGIILILTLLVIVF